MKWRPPSVDEPGILSEPDPRPPAGPLTTLGRTLDAQLAAAQRQLDDVREQLTDSQRLAAIGTIAAVIAHEFNNLLTPMVSYSQFAMRTAEQAEPDMALIRKALAKSYQA